MSVIKYQEHLRTLLQHKLNSETVCEWRTQMNEGVYSPRLDIAVGPFSTVDGIRLTQEYNQLLHDNRDFIKDLIKVHFVNLDIINDDSSEQEIEERINQKYDDLNFFNFNSRCFLSIEIENSVTRKHLMGGAINASVLGRIAIAVGFTKEMHKAFLNLYRYFLYLQNVDKPTFRTNNLLIISSDQLLNLSV